MRKKTVAGMVAAALCAALLVVAGWDGMGEKTGETQAKLENAAHNAKETVVDKAGEAKDAIKEKTKDAGEAVSDKAEEVKKDVKDKAGELKDGYERGYDKEKK